MKLEQRAVLELRARDRKLEGLAARFGVAAKIGDFTETIQRGAFTKSLASGNDILALMDHDTGKLLGRTRSGTLRLSEAADGLAFEITLPDTTAARDALELVRTNNAGGMSFGFLPIGEQWDGRNRTLTEIDLREISLVSSWPAYEGTEVHARAKAPRLAAALRFLETC